MNGLEKAEPKTSQTFSCCLQMQQAADGCCGIASFLFLSHLHNSIILNTLMQKILKDAFKGPVFTCGTIKILSSPILPLFQILPLHSQDSYCIPSYIVLSIYFYFPGSVLGNIS